MQSSGLRPHQQDIHRSSTNYVTLLRDRITCTKALSLDVLTRWNSTYLMLEFVEPYEEVFKMCGGLYATYIADLMEKKHDNLLIGPPEAADWLNVRKIIEYLKKFYEFTLLVSGSTYSTSHLFLLEMCDIFDLIYDLEHNDNHEISTMAIKMRFKIDKYCREENDLNPRMNKILYIVFALDPRQKMKHVEKCFKSVYGTQQASDLMSKVTNSMNDLFEFYLKLHRVNSPLARAPNTSIVLSCQGRRDRQGALTCLALDSDEESDKTNKNELTLYLTEKQHKLIKDEVDQFDILQWWSKNSPRYPVLSEMARDILAILISNVASKATFSTGGRVLSPYRSSLAASMVEALICAED